MTMWKLLPPEPKDLNPARHKQVKGQSNYRVMLKNVMLSSQDAERNVDGAKRTLHNQLTEAETPNRKINQDCSSPEDRELLT
ncbi:hypothetical protein LXA11_17795, partial [Erwinia amylovora]|nr:hypothetical protein [Erwinia amylovora]